NKKLVFTISLLLFTYFSFCQEYRNSGFSKPMNLPFNLAGSFGEPRKDHFHSGIDIKTNGVEGEPVFAIGDGYISRIKVSPYGYGKVIYITHTNGFTSVYAHLSTFYGAIEKYIHSQHYVQQKSELDLTLDATIFPVKQKDTIAFSGNTGGSTAPHLHFEIRNTKTEHALNPLDFYPKEFYVDTIPPQINKVKINSIYSDIYSSFSQYYFLKKVNNNLNAIDSIIIENDTLVSFSFEGFDKQDNSENKNGIKKMIIFQENRLGFKYDLTEIDFDKTRMCNAFVDYHEMMNDSGYFYNGYQLPGNKLNYYSVGNGTFPLKNGRNEFYITCYDYNENEIKINLTVFKRDADVMVDTAAAYNPDEIYGDISINKNDSIPLKNFKINLSANTFYDNNFLSIEKSTKGRIEQYLVSNFALTIPLQKPAKIEFKSSIKKNRNKIVVVRQNHKGNETALKTTFDKNKFYAETKELGSFYLKYDTTKPTVEILNLKSEIINIKITDNLSSINTYNGYVDNKWVNFYYDAKNDVIQYNFDEYCSKGEHLLKIIVTDIVGNKTMIQQKFNY
ncbi:MAG TPA: M23 family metallopeptidase, partial [Chitinophagales bacterium]|nr:M23 family metallopeptidase [Chitinophagales bacterium]